MKIKNKIGIKFIREALPYMKYNQLFHIIHLVETNSNKNEIQENDAILKIVNEEIKKRDEKYNKKYGVICQKI